MAGKANCTLAIMQKSFEYVDKETFINLFIRHLSSLFKIGGPSS